MRSLFVALILKLRPSEGSEHQDTAFRKLHWALWRGQHPTRLFYPSCLQAVALSARTVPEWVTSALNEGTLQPLSLWQVSHGPSRTHAPSTFTSCLGNQLWRPGRGVTSWPAKPLPGREAVLGFCGMVGRTDRLGLGDCRRGFGLVGLLERLRDLEPASTLSSALVFFSGVPKPKRFSGCTLGTFKMKMSTKSTLL